MKKLVLTSVCALAVTGAAFAQGTVNWGSAGVSPAAFTAQTNATTYTPLLGGGAGPAGGTVGATATAGGGFYYQLLFAAGVGVAQPATLASLQAVWNAAPGLTATNQTGTAGRATSSAANTGAAVPWANGTTNSIMMAGWSANLGTTYAAALATLQNPGGNALLLLPGAEGFFGLSATGFINPGTANPGVTVFANAAGSQGLPIFSLNTQLFLVPVPEPGTMALAALGGASLLLFRRKK